jgi:hypothetical protein
MVRETLTLSVQRAPVDTLGGVGCPTPLIDAARGLLKLRSSASIWRRYAGRSVIDA